MELLFHYKLYNNITKQFNPVSPPLAKKIKTNSHYQAKKKIPRSGKPLPLTDRLPINPNQCKLDNLNNPKMQLLLSNKKERAF